VATRLKPIEAVKIKMKSKNLERHRQRVDIIHARIELDNAVTDLYQADGYADYRADGATQDTDHRPLR